ncbi:MAG: hypothetical protein IPK83_06250 [Planctomycetes bacterium]|nr:hypothetical protein [Planctomycetota bacterium]
MTPINLPDGGDGEPRGACPPVTRAHTDADFTGGSFTAQAGFAQSEIAAVSFVIPAADFPIRIDTAEMIFATSNASVQTVTQWSILFWSGTPATGALVDSFSSDDLILPHIRVGPGTAGVNVQVSVDPGDPEQIFISDSGNHTFSVGYRIDVHNNQTANPCFTAPPSSSNAFPTTDVSGLAQSAQNWLFGVNCGSFGCPPNGGWSTFQALNVLCRPSGDWVLRVTYTPVNCAGFGACCNPSNGICTVLTEVDCTTQGNNWSGEGTSCTPNNCPQPTGACCRANGTCSSNIILAACSATGETFFQNQACAEVSCPQPEGACCTNDSGTPCVVVDAATCASVYSGFFKGAFTDCIANACNGACCFSTSSCLSLTKPGCTQISGSQFQGVGVACLASNQCPKGACCLASGACTFGTQIDCNTQGGNYQGNTVTCAAANCPQPSGACCLDGGGCLELVESECGVIPDSSWAGPGTSCQTACQAPSGACCFDGTNCLELIQSDCSVIEGSTWSGAGTVCPGDCQPACPGADGDMNGDTLVNGIDVGLFTSALVNGGTPSETCHGDFNDTSALDYGDVDGMVTALLAAP